MSTDTPLTDAMLPLTPPDQWRAFAKKLERELGEAKASNVALSRKFLARCEEIDRERSALLAQQAATIAHQKSELEEMAQRMVAWTESPAGDLFTTREKLQTANRVCCEQATEIKELEATIAGLTDQRNELMDEHRTIAEKSVAPYIDQLNALTSMAEVLHSDRDRLAGEVERLKEVATQDGAWPFYQIYREACSLSHLADGARPEKVLEGLKGVSARLATAEKDAQRLLRTVIAAVVASGGEIHVTDLNTAMMTGREELRQYRDESSMCHVLKVDAARPSAATEGKETT